MCICINLGLARTPNGMNYAATVRVRSGPFEMFTSNEIAQQWPVKLIEYLKSRIHFIMPLSKTDAVTIELNPGHNKGLPSEILGKYHLLLLSSKYILLISSSNIILYFQGCTNVGGALKYWCKWTMNGEKVVPSGEAKKKFPQMIIEFLESKIDQSMPTLTNAYFPSKFEQQPRGHNKNLFKLYIKIIFIYTVTRRIHRDLIDANINMNPTLTVVRSVSLEKDLLRQPSKLVKRRQTGVVQPLHPSKIVERRHTSVVAPPVASPDAQPRTLNPKKIPFGARGRKRKTLLFIGLCPNLEKSLSKQTSAGPSQQATARLSPIPSPAYNLHYSSDSD